MPPNFELKKTVGVRPPSTRRIPDVPSLDPRELGAVRLEHTRALLEA